MWKYVSRRIRDSVERTYNILETRRTWACGGGSENVQQQNNACPSSSNTDDDDIKSQQLQELQKYVVNSNCLHRFSNKQWNGSSSSGKDDFKQRFDNECKFQQNVLGALTWSSAIICGWYTSQLMCMRRRNSRNGWNSKCIYSKTIFTPSRAFHSNVLSHWVHTSPKNQSPTNNARIWFENAFIAHDTEKHLYQINNENSVDIRQDELQYTPKKVKDLLE